MQPLDTRADMYEIDGTPKDTSSFTNNHSFFNSNRKHAKSLASWREALAQLPTHTVDGEHGVLIFTDEDMTGSEDQDFLSLEPGFNNCNPAARSWLPLNVKHKIISTEFFKFMENDR